MRSILKGGSDADVANVVAYGKRIAVYPPSRANAPPAIAFIDAVDVDSTRRSPTIGAIGGAGAMDSSQGSVSQRLVDEISMSHFRGRSKF
jgi:hypothetical protein